MISIDVLLAKYQAGEIDAIADALKLLHDNGVFLHQANENKLQLINSFEKQEVSELANQILEVRQTNRTLLALHELGATVKEGIQNA